MVCNDELLFIIVLAFQNKFTFFFIKPELPWCCNDEDEKFVYICYLCSLLAFFFTVKVRVYLVKSGITYKVSTVRCTFNKKSDMFYRLQFKVI